MSDDLNNTYHSFNESDSRSHGIECAIFIKQIKYIFENDLNLTHEFIDGNKWIKFSLQDFVTILPYWSKNSISTIIKKLISKNVIERQYLFFGKLDKTYWYRFKE